MQTKYTKNQKKTVHGTDISSGKSYAYYFNKMEPTAHFHRKKGLDEWLTTFRKRPVPNETPLNPERGLGYGPPPNLLATLD